MAKIELLINEGKHVFDVEEDDVMIKLTKDGKILFEQ